MISDQETNKVFLSGKLKHDFKKTCSDLEHILKSFNCKYEFLPETKDIWARDYMPLQISENKFIEFRYDPDYLQGDTKGFRDLKTYTNLVCDAINLKTIKSDLIIDGGNVVKSENCIVLTDKVVKENRFFYTQKELINKLHEIFEVEKVILIPWDRTEEYGHSDGMIRFINENTVLLQGYFEKYDKSFKHKLYRTLARNGLTWVQLKYMVKKQDRRNWAYINFLQTKDLIIVPALNIDEDDQALDQIKQYYPDYARKKRICQAEAANIVKAGGALNCITWTVKETL
jgi:agmatine deiminase